LRAITEFIHVRTTLRDEMRAGTRQLTRHAVDILLDSVERRRGNHCARRNTSVVWGMPGQAVKWGAVERVLPLSLIAAQSLIFAAR
jgi:hypothetical protein